jgi:hypothetical protein
MTGWNTAKRRYRLVHQAAADIAQSGQRGLTQWQPVIEAEYGNVDNFLRDIQARYFITVLARLDAVIEANPADPQAPTAAVFAEAARVHPDLQQVLHDYAGHPALAEGSSPLPPVRPGRHRNRSCRPHARRLCARHDQTRRQPRACLPLRGPAHPARGSLTTLILRRWRKTATTGAVHDQPS